MKHKCISCGKEFDPAKTRFCISLPDSIYVLGGKGVVAPAVRRGYYCSLKCFQKSLEAVKNLEKVLKS